MVQFTAEGRSARAVALVFSLVVALALLPGATAAAPSNADRVVGPDETVTGDLTAMTGDIVVRGTVGGDVTAVSGSVEVADGGAVGGDVTAAAGSVTVAGTVDGDATAAAGSVDVTGDGLVSGSASAGGGSVSVAEGATVEGDANAGGGDVEVAGTVGRDAASGGSVVLAETGSVGGDVTYRESLDRADGAVVDGEVTHESDSGWHVGVTGFDGALEDELTVLPSPFVGLATGLAALVAGALLLVLFPAFSTEVVETATGDPLRSGAAGLAALVAVPVVLVAVALTVIGLPVAFAGGALFGLSAWLALVYGEYVVGTRALAAVDVDHRWAALAVGVVAVEALSRVPVLGDLVTFAVALLGLGAGALALAARRRGDRDEGSETPPPDVAPDAA